MADYSKFRSKKEKWLGIALLLAITIIFMTLMIYSGVKDDNITPEGEEVLNTENKSNLSGFFNYILIGVIILMIILYFTRKKDIIGTIPDEEIINFIANEVHTNQGVYLNDHIENVRVQRGAPGETYVEFLKEAQTYLHYDGVGIIERYPGESIKTVKRAKADDEIAKDLAKLGIARKKHKETLERLGLIDEEEV